MRSRLLVHTVAMAAALSAGSPFSRGAQRERSPADALPPSIRQLTHFGERADFSHDGKRILFLNRTFGDVYELELATGAIRPVTHHYPHEGYTRALYLANGDILLAGNPVFDAKNPGPSRATTDLWILDKSLTKPPVNLGEKCSEGPAVSRKRMRFAWTVDHGDAPSEVPQGVSQIWMADVETAGGAPHLANKRKALDSRDLPFRCNLECQNFRPPDEKELTFSAYGYQDGEVCGINLETKQVTDYSNAPDQYDEPEGVSPNGTFTLVESDRENGAKQKGSQYVDIWKLRLDGSGRMERVTRFNLFPGYKSSNPVISDDGRYMAFQMARVGDPAGFGRGLFLYDFRRAEEGRGK